MIMPRLTFRSTAPALAALLLGGCVLPPLAPSVQVMPAPGKPYEQFAAEDGSCRQYAGDQVAGAAEAANANLANSVIFGTLIGAGLGAALGRGEGAAFGAATGALIGTSLGSNGSAWAQMTTQQRYDLAYVQCMYAKGNQVPGYSVVTIQPAPPGYVPPYGYPAPGYPPPPYGYPPPR